MTREEISITKAFTFDAAHALENYNGKCRHIHGHTYHLLVTIQGEIKNEKTHPLNGMIVDFSDLKNWVKQSILCRFDHTLLLEEDSKNAQLHFPEKEKVYITSYTPTCENMLLDIVSRLKQSIPEEISLKEVRLQETPTSFATWTNFIY